MPSICKVSGCNRQAVCNGLCMRCYGRTRKPSKTSRRLHRKSLLAKHKDAWSTLNGIRQRCNNPNCISYPNYGGRGIKVCERWSGKDGLKNFIEDMGDRPSGLTDGGRSIYSIDRINLDGDYCPDNCRWATIWEQAAKTTRSVKNVGVYHKSPNTWRAELTVNKKTYSKTFRTEKAAIKYRKYLERKYLY